MWTSRGLQERRAATRARQEKRSLADRRASPRRALRWRSGKVLAHDGRLVWECAFRDASDHGLGIRLLERAAILGTLPEGIIIADDVEGVARTAEFRWRGPRDAGLHWTAAPVTSDVTRRARLLRKPFFAA